MGRIICTTFSTTCGKVSLNIPTLLCERPETHSEATTKRAKSSARGMTEEPAGHSHNDEARGARAASGMSQVPERGSGNT